MKDEKISFDQDIIVNNNTYTKKSLINQSRNNDIIEKEERLSRISFSINNYTNDDSEIKFNKKIKDAHEKIDKNDKIFYFSSKEELYCSLSSDIPEDKLEKKRTNSNLSGKKSNGHMKKNFINIKDSHKLCKKSSNNKEIQVNKVSNKLSNCCVKDNLVRGLVESKINKKTSNNNNNSKHRSSLDYKTNKDYFIKIHEINKDANEYKNNIINSKDVNDSNNNNIQKDELNVNNKKFHSSFSIYLNNPVSFNNNNSNLRISNSNSKRLLDISNNNIKTQRTNDVISKQSKNTDINKLNNSKKSSQTVKSKVRVGSDDILNQKQLDESVIKFIGIDLNEERKKDKIYNSLINLDIKPLYLLNNFEYTTNNINRSSRLVNKFEIVDSNSKRNITTKLLSSSVKIPKIIIKDSDNNRNNDSLNKSNNKSKVNKEFIKQKTLFKKKEICFKDNSIILPSTSNINSFNNNNKSNTSILKNFKKQNNMWRSKKSKNKLKQFKRKSLSTNDVSDYNSTVNLLLSPFKKQRSNDNVSKNNSKANKSKRNEKNKNDNKDSKGNASNKELKDSSGPKVSKQSSMINMKTKAQIEFTQSKNSLLNALRGRI